MTKKKDLGQFFTTNSDYILQGFEQHVCGKTVLDPFAGYGDLLDWAERNGAKDVSGLDIDPKMIDNRTSLNDSLKSIPHTLFNITNPPYLGRNKLPAKMKAEYSMEYDDLYLLSMKKIIDSNADEGIIIIPVNFFSAKNSDALRQEFLTRYQVSRVNYFREQVFADTTYNVVAFYYTMKQPYPAKQTIEVITFPEGTKKTYELDPECNYRIAGKELHKVLTAPPLKVIRLTEDYVAKHPGNLKVSAFFNDKNTIEIYRVSPSLKKTLENNILLLNCIDTNASEDAWINLEDVRDLGQTCLVGKNTSRNIAYILLPDVSLSDQKKIIPMFNRHLNALRKKYNSLFLTNFRDNDRKRVSFEFCYKLISYCYHQLYGKI